MKGKRLTQAKSVHDYLIMYVIYTCIYLIGKISLNLTFRGFLIGLRSRIHEGIAPRSILYTPTLYTHTYKSDRYYV